MEAQAYIKNVRVTPKKLRFLLPEVRKLAPQAAIDRLLYVEQKPAKMLRQAIQSAVANAKIVLKVHEGALTFKTLTVEEGHKMKRYKAGGRGTAKPFVRQFAHIKVVLIAKKSVEQPVQKALPATTAKKEDKKEAGVVKSKKVTKKATK